MSFIDELRNGQAIEAQTSKASALSTIKANAQKMKSGASKRKPRSKKSNGFIDEEASCSSGASSDEKDDDEELSEDMDNFVVADSEDIEFESGAEDVDATQHLDREDISMHRQLDAERNHAETGEQTLCYHMFNINFV